MPYGKRLKRRSFAWRCRALPFAPITIRSPSCAMSRAKARLISRTAMLKRFARVSAAQFSFQVTRENWRGSQRVVNIGQPSRMDSPSSCSGNDSRRHCCKIAGWVLSSRMPMLNYAGCASRNSRMPAALSSR